MQPHRTEALVFLQRPDYIDGEAIPLRPKEFEVLLYLVQCPGMVITRDDLMNVVWGFDYIGASGCACQLPAEEVRDEPAIRADRLDPRHRI